MGTKTAIFILTSMIQSPYPKVVFVATAAVLLKGVLCLLMEVMVSSKGNNIISHFTPLHFHFTSLHFTPLHSTSLHFTSLRFTLLYSSSLHFTSLHSTPLHFIPVHFTSLHSTSLYFTPVHSTLLHFPKRGQCHKRSSLAVVQWLISSFAMRLHYNCVFLSFWIFSRFIAKSCSISTESML